MLERVLARIEAIDTEHWLYLAELGWFRVLRYPEYHGTNPRTGEPVFVAAKGLLVFTPHPNLLHELDGEPPEDIGDPMQTDGSPIHHDAWADAWAKEMKSELVRSEKVDVAGFGTLHVERSPDRANENTRVRWETDEALRARLVTRRPM